MSQTASHTTTNRPRFSMFKHADDLSLIAAARRFACQRNAIEALHDQYAPFDPPTALLHAMHDSLDNARDEVAGIPAATKDGLEGQGRRSSRDARGLCRRGRRELARSLANDCVALG